MNAVKNNQIRGTCAGIVVGRRVTNMKCPYCKKQIDPKDIASEIGRHNSEAKKKAARENGKKGGRPRKERQNALGNR